VIVTESNSCIFGPLLGPLHDGELPDDRRRDVMEHVRTCAACSAELADIRRFGSVLSTAALPSLPQERADELFARSRQIAEASPRGAAEPAHLRYVRWVSGVAAAVFVLAIGQVVYQRMSPEPKNLMPTDAAQFETTVPAHPVAPQKPSTLPGNP